MNNTAPASRVVAAVPLERAPAPDEEKYPSWHFKKGTTVCEHFTVLKHLGGGSSYEVFLVWDERLFAVCVAKLLRPDRINDAHSLRDLTREAELLKCLSHPTLVRGFGAVLDGPHPYVLLELVEGPTLSRLIKREGALPLLQVLPTLLHVGAVLQYLALRQVVHLDIKPGNIVMGIPPRLIDLSIARTTDDAARLRSAIGTDAYMAPEQCDARANPGRIGLGTDIWGLGATLYHAAAGRVPFPRPDDWEKNEEDVNVRFPQILADPDPLPKHLPSALCDLILRMLNKDPDQRPPLAEVVAELEPLVKKVTSPRRGLRRFGRPY
jgi:serine/threonine protein kinase